MLFEETLDIIDERPPLDENGRTDSGFVAWQKNRAWQRMEMAKKLNPAKYGDKIGMEHTGADGGPIQHEVRPFTAMYADMGKGDESSAMSSEEADVLPFEGATQAMHEAIRHHWDSVYASRAQDGGKD